VRIQNGPHTRIAASFVLVLFFGCAADDVYFEPNMDFGSLQTVAVLPFQNLTNQEYASERIRDAFMGRLLATGAVYVLPPGEVATGIQRAGRIPPEGPSIEQVKKLGAVLGVDAVITGVVTEYGPVRSGSTSANVVSLSLQMVEISSGLVVWSASTTRGGISIWDRFLGGGGEPMNSVTVKVVDDLLDKLFE